MATATKTKTPSDSRSTSTTAAADEIARFSEIAAAWWDPDGDFRPLHRLNPLRIGYIRDHVAAHFGRDRLGDRPLRDLELIDVGCGGGLLAEPLSRLGATVTAIDASHQSIGVARTHAAEHDLAIDYQCTVPEALVDAGRQFDVVVNMEVVEHAADRDAFLEACAALVRPGGVMAVSTLNRTLKSLALAKIGAEYVLRWLPVGTHDWRKFVRPSELAAGLRRHGLDIVDVAGMTYDPLRDRWSLGRDVSVNYLLFAIKD